MMLTAMRVRLQTQSVKSSNTSTGAVVRDCRWTRWSIGTLSVLGFLSSCASGADGNHPPSGNGTNPTATQDTMNSASSVSVTSQTPTASSTLARTEATSTYAGASSQPNHTSDPRTSADSTRTDASTSNSSDHSPTSGSVETDTLGDSTSGAPSSSEAPTGGTTSGEMPSEFFPCEGANPAEYDVVATRGGATWSVTKSGQSVYSGSDFEQALISAYDALTANRTAKESILVMGDGEISASSQVRVPSYTVLNVCGTVNVTGTPSGSDRSPFYARSASHIDIPNLKLTGSPQYGIFFRQTDDIHLGQIELSLTRSAGIGIRIDSGPNAGSSTDFNRNLTIDHVYGTGMGSHIVETYGIDQIKIGSVEGEDVGECGLLLNRSINAEVGSVTCTGCATGNGYAAFRVANSVGKIGNDFPSGNIHVGKVTARGGGRGIFSVSGCGGLVIDEIDIADTGSTSILMQNTYNTVIAAKSGTVSGGIVQLTNDTDNTNEGVYPPSRDVTLQNLTLTNGASVRQDWCDEFGSNGCTANNITGGAVSMCQ